ncbi:hypothetical protein PVT68_12690 [Microbulbifer bruguierae]|uniref:DUF5667 domain-containing protein n=1 Tax=Microbulbifer bruguierae TaxID=3029061 RepID=A0ABY8NAF5_9GAMM|nr:hypothetical protein [Microbulbifer bruguierae]WGL15625.1 hypothetical protein PVT68_12690 [Microbulbifer bruguierae]
MKLIAGIALISLAASVSLPSHAIGPGDLKKFKEETAATAPSGDIYATQDGLVKQFSIASHDIGVAQIGFAEALGLKQEAAALREVIEAEKSGAVMEKDAIQRFTELSSATNKKIEKQVAEGGELSAEAKDKYAAAFLPLFKGLYESKKIGGEAETFISSAKQTISSASMMEKMKVTKKLSSGMYVAKEVPGFTKQLFDTSSLLFSYAKDQSIAVPADPTGEINFD